MFVRVAVNIASDKTFIYAVPDRFEKDIATGKRVLVPLEKRRLPGYILETVSASSFENTKDIIDIIDTEPLFNEDDLKFYQWVSRYYIYPPGKTLSEILPGGIDLKSNRWITPAKGKTDRGIVDICPFHERIMDILTDFPDGIPLKRLKHILGKKDIYRDIRTLRNMELIDVEDRIEKPEVLPKKEKVATVNAVNTSSVKLTKNQQRLTDFLGSHGPSSFATLRESFKNVAVLVKALEHKGILHISEEEVYRQPDRTPDIGREDGIIIPNEDQKLALREILKGIESRRFSPCLLHGVTGSGKTEVYLNAIEEVSRLEGGVIYLVPEIALTPQLLTRLNRRFPGREIAVLHSGISKAARYDQWRRIQRGDIRIVVGARSAVFAPVRALKLIIVDEEHDPSYKQDDRMRYNARDAAVMKAQLLSATVVLGSATPAIQTYFNTMRGKYKYLVLPGRVEERRMPVVEIVDMKREKGGTDAASLPILSRALREAIQNTLEARMQILLFLNRRGFHTFMFCPDCGHILKCLSCAVSLTYHAGAGLLKCHYCDFSAKAPEAACPECRGKRIRRYGVGTERLEEEIKRGFPGARVGRMDSDTTTGKGAYEKILLSLDRHEIDILVGTQMITKGHDFHDVTLVGIISADTSLNLPDFRAAERTFQLLTQASGRGGRGVYPGRVIIQTVNPDHYAITRAGCHDYPGFYGDELSLRKGLSYPPYSRIVNLHLSSTRKDAGTEGIEKLKTLVKELIGHKTEGRVDIIGPAESPIARIKGRYRWQLLLRGQKTIIMNRLIRNILSKAAGTGLEIKVDVDPVNFM